MPLTQAQVDRLRGDVEALAIEVSRLVADGPTPPPGPPGNLGTIVEYDGAFFGAKGFRIVGVSQGGVAYGEPRPVWGGVDPTYICHPGASPLAKPGDVCGTADWSSSREYHRVPEAMFHGEPWLWIDGYGPSSGVGFYPVETVRADWVNVDTGVVVDVTPPGPAPQGQPYIPATVYGTGHWRIRIWGWVWGSMTSGRSGQFYWEGDFTYGTTMVNVAWKGDAAKTRPVIVIREGWWNGGHSGAWIGWSTGSSPYDVQDNPIVPTNTYQGFNSNARGVGTMWVFSYPPNVAGIESIHT